jgi:hypothetical protein
MTDLLLLISIYPQGLSIPLYPIFVNPDVPRPSGAFKAVQIAGLKAASPEVPARADGCYNAAMTLVDITYELQSPLSEEQLQRLGEFANTYGLRKFRVDEDKKHLSFEYDASRLRETQVEHVLGRASIPVIRRVN